MSIQLKPVPLTARVADLFNNAATKVNKWAKYKPVQPHNLVCVFCGKSFKIYVVFLIGKLCHLFADNILVSKSRGKCRLFVPVFTDNTVVGKSEDNAKTLLSDLQAELQFNQRYINDFGPQFNSGDWQEGQFVTQDDCAFFALGRGQSPRGLRHRSNRPDYIVIDDLDDDELCLNDARVSKLTDWVKEALFGTFGAQGGRFVMVGNLISKCSVLANVAKTKGVFVSKVNVYDKWGNPSWPEFWKPDKIQAKADFMGYRAFQKEYMNNPITEGAVFRNDWIRWKRALPLREYAELVLYIDPSFKPTTKNDFKAAKLWGKTKAGELHHIKAFCRQTTVVEMVRWVYDLYERIRDANGCVLYHITGLGTSR